MLTPMEAMLPPKEGMIALADETAQGVPQDNRMAVRMTLRERKWKITNQVRLKRNEPSKSNAGNQFDF